ncbi:MAG: alpha/beta hydrolase [Gammaproteobacteria bacterium]|nr:alpha/beta hydrolase [Gammaproteobacteria bacterium]
MTEDPSEPLTLNIDGQTQVSGLWLTAPEARACFVFGHGAGAGMRHAFMSMVAGELAQRGIATLRYQFPYMERRSRRPDPPAICHATVRAACAEAARRAPDLRLLAGGKSFGGRMTSQAQAAAPLPGVNGLAFLSFPLHPAGKPAMDRAEHLRRVQVPMLFLQGTRDELADLQLLTPVVAGLGERATLTVLEEADHSWQVPARTGRKDAQVIVQAMDVFARWAQSW